MNILHRLNDSLNPIVVKELQQAAQGKFLAAVLMLLLVVQLSAIWLFLAFSGDISNKFHAGPQIFMVLLGILLATCLLFVPAYTGVRLASERSDTGVDLLFITTITPRAIIAGKLLAAITLIVLIYSACMPFMILTYFLRGIDLPSIFVLLALGFLVVAASTQLAIFIACVSTNRVVQVLLGLIGFILLFITFILTMVDSSFLLMSGIGSFLWSWDFWGRAFGVLLSGLTVIGMLFVLSMAHLSPASANRALPVRVFILIVWLVTGVVAVTWRSVGIHSAVSFIWGGAADTLNLWSVLSVYVFCIAFFVAVSERENLGRRLARTVPPRRWIRLPAFLFYSGAANGVAWAFVMISLTIVAVWGLAALSPSLTGHPKLREDIEWMTGMGLYAFCYALSALLLRRRFFANKIKSAYTWIIALVLLGIGSILPFLISYFLFFDDWKTHDSGVWSFGNPFALGIDSYRRSYLIFASLWAAVVAWLSRSWFMQQVKSFRPDQGRMASQPLQLEDRG